MSTKKKFVSSSAWVAAGNGADNAIQFAIFAVLARLLPVSEIGVVALAMALIDVLRVVAGAGTSEAVIRRPSWDDEFASTAFWLNITIALLLCFVAVPVVLSFPALLRADGNVLAISCLFLLLIVDSLRAVHVAKLRKEFNFRNIAMRTVLSGVVSGIFAIGLAILGAGIWSLVAQRLLYGVLTTIQTWRAARWMPGRSFCWPVIVELIPFSLKVLGSRIIDIFSMRLPDFMIGIFFGAAALGFFKVGSRALDAVTQLVIKPVQFATLPALAEAGRNGRLSSSVLRMTRFFAVIICPAMIGSGVLADDLVRLFFSGRYLPSASIMQILAASALPATLSFFIGPALVAKNQAGYMLVLSSLQLCLTALCMFLFGREDITVAAVSIVVSQFLWVPACIYVLHKVFDIALGEIIPATAKPFTAALFMGALVAYCKRFTPEWPAAFGILFGVALGAASYSVFLRLVFPLTFGSFVDEARELTRFRRNRA